MLTYLVQSLGLGLIAGMQPGPFQAYLISLALERGWRRSISSAFAPLLSDGPIIVLVLLVLSQMPVWLSRFLYIAGGLFMLYLAYGTFRSWQKFNPAAVTVIARKGSVLKAALVNLLNPAPYIYWSLVTGPILMMAWREAALNGLLFLLGFYAAMISIIAVIMIAAASAGRIDARINQALLGITAIALVLFGLFQLWQGVQG